MLTFLLLVACTPEPEANYTGEAMYPDRAPVARDDAPEQGVTFEAEFGGTGTFGDLSGVCLPTDGAFSGTTTSEGTIDSEGGFAGQIDASGSASLLSSLGCVTEALEIDEITTLTITASIVADTENCTYYCESHARSTCEAEAGEAGGSAECEAEVAGACTEECTTERHAIVAETAIEGAALVSLNEGLDGEVFGAFSGELTFDRME